jgi:cytochrome P450
MSLRILGQDIVVLSSPSAIKDLLERRGESYSDRPSFPLHEMYALAPILHLLPILQFGNVRLGVDWLLPILKKGEEWADSRKLLDRSLRASAPTSYRRMMEEKTRAFLGQLLATPKDFRDHIEL